MGLNVACEYPRAETLTRVVSPQGFPPKLFIVYLASTRILDPLEQCVSESTVERSTK